MTIKINGLIKGIVVKKFDPFFLQLWKFLLILPSVLEPNFRTSKCIN